MSPRWTFGHRQTRLRADPGQAGRRPRLETDLPDLKVVEGGELLVEPLHASRADEDLGKGERARRERPRPAEIARATAACGSRSSRWPSSTLTSSTVSRPLVTQLAQVLGP